MNKLKNILMVCLLIAAISCKEEKHAPLSDNGAAPAPVIDAKVESALPGGAKLTYKLPDDQNILYVKAVYESPKGNFREVKSSLYSKALIIDGLGTTDEYEVKLYAVSRSEKESAPVSLKVVPLAPPVLSAFTALELTADFGGVLIDYKNPSAGNIIINFMTKNSLGDWTDIERYYTKTEEGKISVTGLPAGKNVYGVFISDRWNNRSDTLAMELTPLAERKLDKLKFTEHLMGTWNPSSGAKMLPLAIGSDWSQWYQNRNDTRLSAVWDDKVPGVNYVPANQSHFGTYNTAGGAPLPGSFTINLGVKTKLSRLVYNARIDNKTVLWSHNGMMNFEVWGTTLDKMVDQTNPSFSANGWQKLLDCKVVKPSGLPNTAGNVTNEDLDLIVKGFEFRFPLNTPEVQLLRFRVLKTFNGSSDWHISELTFWGQDN